MKRILITTLGVKVLLSACILFTGIFSSQAEFRSPFKTGFNRTENRSNNQGYSNNDYDDNETSENYTDNDDDILNYNRYNSNNFCEEGDRNNGNHFGWSKHDNGNHNGYDNGNGHHNGKGNHYGHHRGNYNPCDPSTPIDGGVSLFIAAGLGLSALGFKRKKAAV